MAIRRQGDKGHLMSSTPYGPEAGEPPRPVSHGDEHGMAKAPWAYGIDAAWLEQAMEQLPALVGDVLESQQSLLPDQVREVMDAMAIGLEELRVAEEELAAQAEDLEASQRVIEAERERYANLFEFAPDCYLETDQMGKIIEANSAAVIFFGVPGRGLVGKLVQSFVAVEDRRGMRSGISALNAGGDTQEFSVELHPRGGPPRRAEIRVGAHIDPNGDGCRLRWLIRDVTDKVKRERELEQLRASV